MHRKTPRIEVVPLKEVLRRTTIDRDAEHKGNVVREKQKTEPYAVGVDYRKGGRA